MFIAARPLTTIRCAALGWALSLTACEDSALDVPHPASTHDVGSTAPRDTLAVETDPGRTTVLPDAGPTGASCSVDGHTYKHGERYMCADGCNFCHCENGQIASSARACALKTCETGFIVSSQRECPPPKGANATCALMQDGTWCTAPLEGTSCPAGSRVIAADAPCTGGAHCYAATAALRCELFYFTVQSCSAVGGTPVFTDSLETPWFPEGCASAGGVAIGELYETPAPHQGGLCCAPSPPKACGALAGNSCGDSEFCGYVEGELCGRTDAHAICRPRPLGCGGADGEVCGCDGTTFASACEAASAGQGVFQAGACP